MGLMKGGKKRRKEKKHRPVALQTLSSNSIPVPHALMSALLQIHLRSAIFENIKKANLQATVGGQPDLPGTNFNLYSGCLYQRWLEPKNIPTIFCSLRRPEACKQFWAPILKILHYFRGLLLAIH